MTRLSRGQQRMRNRLRLAPARSIFQYSRHQAMIEHSCGKTITVIFRLFQVA